MKNKNPLLKTTLSKLNRTKTLKHSLCILVLICCYSFPVFSQDFMKPQRLGQLQTIVKPIVNANEKSQAQYQYIITVTNKKTFIIDVESSVSDDYKYYLYGTVKGMENTTFFLRGDDNGVDGKLLDYNNKIAYVLYTNANNEVYIEEVDINKHVCIRDGWLMESQKPNVKEEASNKLGSKALPELESLPGAEGVIYIDFDGENVTGGAWGTVNAAATNFNDADIEKVWYIMAEDFSPYQINVTTIRSVYDNANINSRQMVIFNETFPFRGGVASFNTYNNGDNDPCWVNTTGIINSVWLAANVGSHEAGHTLGLSHDGSSASGPYWNGHGTFNVIMGGCNRDIAQWSIGEYQNSDNVEDDIDIIDRNNSPFKIDDHGNNTGGSSELLFNQNTGEVTEQVNFGIITTRDDKDYFRMELIDGELELNFRPADKYTQSPNLDIQVRLLDASENEIFVSNPDDNMGASIKQTVSAGIYYIEIDGVGFGNPSTNGYSDYASLGQYFISGKVPFNNISAPIASFSSDLKTGCGSLNVAFTNQSEFSPTEWSWDFGDGSPVSSNENPTHTYTAIGNYTVVLTATNQYGVNSSTEVDYISVLDGEEFLTVKTGLENNAITDEGGFYTTPQGLIFTVKEALDLISVKVYADGEGIRTFVLEDNAENRLETVSVNLTDGEQRVFLNWKNIPQGSDYVIYAVNPGNGLYRNKELDIQFSIPNNLIDITCNTFDTTNCNSFYYFFYDWEIRQQGCSESLGLDDYEKLSGIKITPNPAKEVLNINLEQQATSNYDLIMYNVLGAIVKKSNISYASTKSTIDISAMPTGVYIVKVTNEQGAAIFKIVKN